MPSLFFKNNLANIAAIGAASGALYYLVYKKPSLLGIGGGGGGGATGGGGGGDVGGFWKRLLSRKANADENQSTEWDAHGLRAHYIVPLNKLSRSKRYRVSAIELLDKVTSTVLRPEDSFFEVVSLNPGVYTKAQLHKELESLATCGMFEEVDLQAKTNPDGSIALTIPFTESTWENADSFKCINMGLKEQPKSCMLPSSVHGEIVEKLGKGKVSSRMLQNIRDRVHKWYHDKGYACAQVVNFRNLNTKEVVCELIEGDITGVEIQFEDLRGNICEDNAQIEMVKRLIPDQLQKGNVYNIEAWKQVLDNINSLSMFSSIEIDPRADEKNEGGIIVWIKLKELQQELAEVGLPNGE